MTNILQAMDALHVAGAVEWEAGLFVTADHRQFAAAQKAGLKAQLVGSGMIGGIGRTICQIVLQGVSG